MKGKTRYIYLDLVRVVAFAFIVAHHLVVNLNRINFIQSEGLFFLGINYGDVGVSLFIFLSGTVLTVSAIKKRKFSLIGFYKKRVLRLYPLFWLVYLSFLAWYLYNKYLPTNISLFSILLAFLGIDGYLTSFFSFANWYLVGEWFLGFIIILYLIYPYLYKLFRENGYLLLGLSLVVTAVTSVYFNDLALMSMRFIPMRLMEFTAGIYFSRIVLRNKIYDYLTIYVIASLFFIGLGLTDINFRFVELAKFLSLDLILISLFYFICEFFNNEILDRCISFLSNISYSVFLVHHVVIYRYLYNIVIHRNILNFGGKFDSLTFYISQVLLIVILASIFFYYLEKKIIKVGCYLIGRNLLIPSLL